MCELFWLNFSGFVSSFMVLFCGEKWCVVRSVNFFFFHLGVRCLGLIFWVYASFLLFLLFFSGGNGGGGGGGGSTAETVAVEVVVMVVYCIRYIILL